MTLINKYFCTSLILRIIDESKCLSLKQLKKCLKKRGFRIDDYKVSLNFLLDNNMIYEVSEKKLFGIKKKKLVIFDKAIDYYVKYKNDEETSCIFSIWRSYTSLKSFGSLDTVIDITEESSLYSDTIECKIQHCNTEEKSIISSFNSSVHTYNNDYEEDEYEDNEPLQTLYSIPFTPSSPQFSDIINVYMC